LRLISVGRGESDIHVLAGLVSGPIWKVEHEASDAWSFVDDVNDFRDSPTQSPW